MTKKLFMMMILITRVKYQLQMFFYVKEYLCMPHLILARAEGGEGAPDTPCWFCMVLPQKDISLHKNTMHCTAYVYTIYTVPCNTMHYREEEGAQDTPR